MRADKVYLVGFMGAGKTTVGRALAKRLAWPFEDIDQKIETEERRDVAAIFRQNGEAYFRTVERQQVTSLLPTREVVVATGGGTIADPATREVVLRDGAVVWLDVPLAVVLERVPLDGRRPLAADRAGMERLYDQRQFAYQRAHLRLDAGRLAVDELVDRIVQWLGA